MKKWRISRPGGARAAPPAQVEGEEEEEEQDEGAGDEMLTLIVLLPVVAAAGEIVEGKRAKKTVERLDFQAPKQKEKLKIGDGRSWRSGDQNRLVWNCFLCFQAPEKSWETFLAPATRSAR